MELNQLRGIKLQEYRTINDLSTSLKNELTKNASFFSNFDGKSLDEQQRIACILNDCDLEIIAGAGTGKTQTLVAKSSYLIEYKNIKASEILCLSFSKSSAKDLKKRLKYSIETKTIHALGLSIIKKRDEKGIIEEYGFKNIFKEYLDDASQKQLDDIKDFCENYLANVATKIKLNELDTEEEKLNFLISKTSFVKRVWGFIDLFKGKDNDIQDLKTLLSNCKKDYNKKPNINTLENINFLNIVDPIFRFYQRFLSRNHLIDFNDMINNAIKHVEEHGINKNYKYIFVDEYQDVSYKNFQLVKTIKDKLNANLVVVGDDWQSIYGFRDSDLKLFTKFTTFFPNANKVFIEQTYRGPQQLIDSAGKFIMKNKKLFNKSLKSNISIKKPIKIVYHSLTSEKINKNIYNLINNLSKQGKVLILGRHNSDINDFLANTNLVKKGRSKNYKKITDKRENIKKVTYRTIHNAKGLESDYVIIIRVIDDFVGFPNQIPPASYMHLIHDWTLDDKLEEERRLFYVALTRAKKGVYIFTTRGIESEYITELKKDSSNNIEIIYTDDKNTYSHLKEFKIAPKNKVR